MKLKRYRTVLGQLVHPDMPRHCAFCDQTYHRRHLLQLWETRRRGLGTTTVLHRIRICADPGTGCFQKGIHKLFKAQ